MPGKAVFVSRKSASVRRLVNDQQARALLCSLGFRVLECERLTLRQQVQEFSSADIVVGLHGAGLTNIIYSPKGSHVIEILSNSPCKIYESLAVALGMEYKSIVCDGRKKTMMFKSRCLSWLVKFQKCADQMSVRCRVAKQDRNA